MKRARQGGKEGGKEGRREEGRKGATDQPAEYHLLSPHFHRGIVDGSSAPAALSINLVGFVITLS